MALTKQFLQGPRLISSYLVWYLGHGKLLISLMFTSDGQRHDRNNKQAVESSDSKAYLEHGSHSLFL